MTSWRASDPSHSWIHFSQFGMMAFIINMCIFLPITLFPSYLLHRLGVISRVRKEQWSLRAGQFTARWLLRLIPFCKVTTTPYHDENPEPSIWVCNHTSALDIFLLLATDKKLRGRKRRPIKIVYVSNDTWAHVAFWKLSNLDGSP